MAKRRWPISALNGRGAASTPRRGHGVDGQDVAAGLADDVKLIGGGEDTAKSGEVAVERVTGVLRRPFARPAIRQPRGGRAREWLGRYAPAEVAATLGALLGAGVAAWFGGAAATAYAGAIGEAIAFYAVVFVRDQRRSSRRSGDGSPWRTLRGLLMEFGPAELVDTFAVRPLAMYLATVLIGHVATGVLVGKVAADVVFYTLAIIGYEIRRSATTPEPAGARSSATAEGP